MSTEVLLPQWGMGMHEGVVISWLKAEGDAVAEDEPLVEVETEKTTSVVSAPTSGVLAHIAVPVGTVARIYDVLAVISRPDETANPDVRESESVARAEVPDARANHARTDASKAEVEPRARRAARELGITLETLRGTGPGGRITENDVIQAAEPRISEPRRTQLSGVRSAIARRMTQVAQNVPLVTLVREVDVSALHGHLSADVLRRLGYTSIMVRAVALALREHPALNAHMDGDTLMSWGNVHIGVAVDGPTGLIVPVVRDADTKSIEEISTEIRRLSEAVHDGTITADEASGSTFSVTNLGPFGISSFTPLVNPPEVAILGIGRVTEQLGRRENELIQRNIAPLSLTFDHRALDGAPAARFLATLNELLAAPSRLGSVPTVR